MAPKRKSKKTLSESFLIDDESDSSAKTCSSMATAGTPIGRSSSQQSMNDLSYEEQISKNLSDLGDKRTRFYNI
jgi:hypothetical protein